MKKIKEAILLTGLFIFKWHLRIAYFFIKLFSIQKSDVFLLSRQFDSMPLNYELLANKLKEEDINTKVICKKVAVGVNATLRNEKNKKISMKEIGEMFGYYFNLYKQMYYIATSRVVIIDGYNITVSVLKHKKNTKVIQLWHALAAIKKFGYQTIGYPGGLRPNIAKMLCMHKNYDYVISGSKAMNKYFAEAFGIKEEIVTEIGTPIIDYLVRGNEEVVEKILNKYPQIKEKTNILYSPTFRNDGSDDVENVINSIDTKKYNLILTYHPKNNVVLNDDVICVDRNEFLTFDILRVVDYVITDYSALSIDACVLNKKLLLYVYDYEKYEKENGLNIDLFNELKGNVSKNIKDIVEIIDKNCYNVESYENFRNKYVSNLKGNSTEELVNIIKKLL